MLEVSEREEGVVALHLLIGPLKNCFGLEPVRDAIPVPNSPLGDDIATAPSGGRCNKLSIFGIAG